MIWLFALLCAAISFVVAAVSVGSVTSRQATRSRPSVYDLDHAVDYVAEHLDPDVTAVVSYDEVRQVLLWHLDYLQMKGVATYRADDDERTSLVVVTDDEPVAYILGRADDAEVELADDHVVEILRCQEGYYEVIGAIGAKVSDVEDPF